MRNIKSLILVFVFISSIACKENITKTSVKQEIPLQGLVSRKILDTVMLTDDIESWEQGYRFSSSKNGRITKLGCYMPNNLTYRVALWNCNTEDLIAAIPVKVTDSTKFNYQDITPIPIEANKEYLITINNTINNSTKSFFKLGIRSTPYNEITFPITSGLIKIEAGHMASTKTLRYPADQFITYKLYGAPDFVFEPAE
ncbi:MAG TPA: DUF4082 domain-containing protein [Chitinophagaceae bacterium]|nr:DUF4082 domain-containing protein [Chitinophagaceae bacterium]